MSSRLEELQKKDQLSVDEFFDLVRLQRVLNDNVFNPDIEIEEEKPILWVRHGEEKYDICTPGAMVIILGKYKSRKTVVANAITACMLGDREVLGFSSNMQGKNLLYFDTEQKKSTFWKTQRRIFHDAKQTKSVSNYKGILLREFNFRERKEIIMDTVLHEEQQGRKPDVIFIDGLLDLVKDPNDYIETNQMVEMLMHIAAKGITMVMVIHLSNTGTIYGHLGSTLGRKVDVGIEVEMKNEGKDEDGKTKFSEYSVVKPRLTRDTLPFPEFDIFQDRSGKVTRTDLKEVIVPLKQTYTISHPNRENVDEHIPF